MTTSQNLKIITHHIYLGLSVASESDKLLNYSLGPPADRYSQTFHAPAQISHEILKYLIIY